METNTLYYGDCLEWMEKWNDQCVDLIYLDPPFNSKTDYNMLYSNHKAGAQYRAFTDTWSWDKEAQKRFEKYENAAGLPSHDVICGLYRILGESGMLAYLTYMAERLEQMHRLLKPAGSLYLHCDPTMGHYLKIVLDAIFGKKNFRREIIWDIAVLSGFKSTTMNWVRGHDTIFYYVRDNNKIRFNKQKQPHRIEYLNRFNKLDHDGRKYFDGRGKKRYLDEVIAKGKAIGDVWSDIMSFQQTPTSKEYLGFPTQKPLSLLDRVIKASSSHDSIILDPFCGCGTTIEAAQRLNCRWVGIDISSFAIDLIRERRLQDPGIATKGIPYDLPSAQKLARDTPFYFESWAVTRLPGFVPNTKQVADGGVDGRATLEKKPDDWDSKLALAQVKGGKFSLSQFRDFIHVLDRDNAATGCFLTLEEVRSQEARKEALRKGWFHIEGRKYQRVHLWPLSEYFDGPHWPSLPLMTDPYTGKSMQQMSLLSNMS